MTKPVFLFKYKPISTCKDMCRLKDILSYNRIYMPDKDALNDPLESMSYRISVAVAGGGYTFSCGHEHPIVSDEKKEYRILSLSSDIHSPLMWAYYANEQQGCCLMFRLNTSFETAVPIKYTDEVKTFQEGEQEGYDLETLARESLFIKMEDWKHEKEWRIIEKAKPGFMSFEHDELAAVIVGYKMPWEKRQKIDFWCKKRNTSCFCTSVLQIDSRIVFFPADMKELDFEFGYVIDEVRKSYPKETWDLFSWLNHDTIEKWKLMG